MVFGKRSYTRLGFAFRPNGAKEYSPGLRRPPELPREPKPEKHFACRKVAGTSVGPELYLCLFTD